MAKKSMDEMKQLIDMGKEKGFLTYDEVNDLLPPDMVSSEQIDDVMSMFGEMDIEIVDSVQKVKIPLAGPATRSACICARWAPFPSLPARGKWRLPSGSRMASGTWPASS
jgi:sigma-70-like protein